MLQFGGVIAVYKIYSVIESAKPLAAGSILCHTVYVYSAKQIVSKVSAIVAWHLWLNKRLVVCSYLILRKICRSSVSSYPYIAASTLHDALHSIACVFCSILVFIGHIISNESVVSGVITIVTWLHPIVVGKP